MSEYQYYEFAALDKPLTDKQMKELQALSSRAEITPTSFVNEYHFGDFKGNPRKLIAEYFDAFLYYANWGTRRCMFRLPKAAVDVAALKRFAAPEAIDIVIKGKSVVVDICLNDNSGDTDVPYDQTLAPLIPARTALLEGNLGPLYVAWLAAVELHLVEDDARETCDVAQLGPIDAGAAALANFLYVSNKLLKAAWGSAGKKTRVDPPAKIASWAISLPQQEKDDYLAAFIAEPSTVVRSKLLKQFRASQIPRAGQTRAKRRTAGQLRAAAGLE